MTRATQCREQISTMRERVATVALLFAVVLGCAAIPVVQAQTYSVVHNFIGGKDGWYPNGDMIHDAAGNMYGTTNNGGGSNEAGTVFKLDPTGTETILYAFTGQSDGAAPASPLFRDPTGNLYGTTFERGDPTCNCGTVFKLDTNNVLTVLHTFKGGRDGSRPIFGIISVKGQLYGTTEYGGKGCRTWGGCGVIFKVTNGGKYHVLYRFPGNANGDRSVPQALVRDSAGNLYGAEYFDSSTSLGTVFELDTAGTFTLLYTFPGGSLGASPRGRLTRDGNGIIHGTTIGGGDPTCNCGVVYRLDTAGNETVLHKFFGGRGGESPAQGLLDLAGSLYGATEYGGDRACNAGFGCGVVFKVGNTGAYTVLHRFTGGADGGGFPVGELSLNTDGSIYGSTAQGGTGGSCNGGCGVIFKITP
jgi:uncharacterized repeat protein (TIGR03803 family)